MESQPDKRRLIIDKLGKGTIMLYLDARHYGVIVPRYLKKDFTLRINLSLRFKLNDLMINDYYIAGTLSFNRRPFHCTIPLESIWGLTTPPSTKMHVFYKDLPLEVLTMIYEQVISPIEREEDEELIERLTTPSNDTDIPNPSVPVNRKAIARKKMKAKLKLLVNDNPEPLPQISEEEKPKLRLLSKKRKTSEPKISEPKTSEPEKDEN